MQVEEVNIEGLNRCYKVTIPKQTLSDKLDSKITEMQPQVRLKGFRPGKVPEKHIRKMFGSSIMQDIVQELISESSQQALTTHNIRPAGQPQIEMRSDGSAVNLGQADLEYELRVETIPEFEPTDMEVLKFTRLQCEVSDEVLTERLTQMVEGQKSYRKKAKTAKARKDDAVLINFSGQIDGEAFEGGSMESHQLVLGSESFIPGFEDQLIGAKAGETLDIKVHFPDDYGAADLAGKEAIFATEVLEVQGAQDAELNDAFAIQLGLDSLEMLKSRVKESLEKDYAQQSRLKLKRAILDELDGHHDFALPPKMVEAEFQTIWQQVLKEKEAGNLDAEDAKKSEKELEKEYRKISERRVRLGLILAEMGQKATVQISDEELQQALINEARNYPGQEQKVVEFYQKNPQAMAQLRAPVFEEKVIDLIIEKASITDKMVTKDILFAEDEMI